MREDYQTVRDLIWLGLNPVDHGHLQRSATWFGISGDDPELKPKQEPGIGDLVAAEDRRYM